MMRCYSHSDNARTVSVSSFVLYICSKLGYNVSQKTIPCLFYFSVYMR